MARHPATLSHCIAHYLHLPDYVDVTANREGYDGRFFCTDELATSPESHDHTETRIPHLLLDVNEPYDLNSYLANRKARGQILLLIRFCLFRVKILLAVRGENLERRVRTAVDSSYLVKRT
ncbi:hypothetical protein [Klebsiella pneumoniae]|uniref:hypothetical protein n=1 Tax=Klebsiella pneumoniae TaxID=573 RepID=UPI0003BE87BB|nr:hypothetical protein [Klebsiella pneumoniae]ESL52704.1 hypothetical protein L460_01724 [Klebsiella pneumoniae BIDMC 24]